MENTDTAIRKEEESGGAIALPTSPVSLTLVLVDRCSERHNHAFDVRKYQGILVTLKYFKYNKNKYIEL